MRHHTTLALLALLATASAPTMACRILVKFPEHLADDLPNWSEAYRVVEIVEAHKDRIVGRIANSFGRKEEKGLVTTFYFRPNEEAHGFCKTPFEIGETYLIYSTLNGRRREISRFYWMNVPKSHERFTAYVEDLRRARAAE